MKNWKTTAFGVISACLISISQIADLDPKWVEILRNVGATLAALGLLFAKDFNVSHTQNNEKTTIPPSTSS